MRDALSGLPAAVAAILGDGGLRPRDGPVRLELRPTGGQLLWLAVPGLEPTLDDLRRNARVPQAPLVIDPDSGAPARRVAFSPAEWLAAPGLPPRLAVLAGQAPGSPPDPGAGSRLGRTGRLELVDLPGGSFLCARLYANRVLHVTESRPPDAGAVARVVRLLLERAGGTADQFHLLRGGGLRDVERAVPGSAGDERALRRQAERLLAEANEDRDLVELWLRAEAGEVLLRRGRAE